MVNLAGRPPDQILLHRYPALSITTMQARAADVHRSFLVLPTKFPLQLVPFQSRFYSVTLLSVSPDCTAMPCTSQDALS